MRVEKLMNVPAIICRPEDNLDQAANLMWVHDIGAVLVVNSADQLAGIITDRDICMAAFTQGHLLSQIPVSAVMSRNVCFCHADDSLESAERLMRDKQVRRIPVVNSQGGPLGLLSLNDLTRHAARAQGGNGQEHEVLQTLAAISEPRWRRTRSEPAPSQRYIAFPPGGQPAA